MVERASISLSDDVDSMLDEVRDLLTRIESSLPARVDPASVSVVAKIPYNVLVCREALIWRIAELGRSALQCFERNALASAMILTRATLETSAALWHLHGKVDGVIKCDALGDIDDYVMCLMFGSRVFPELGNALNVLTFIDRMDKEIPGLRASYDRLSEFVHPNWFGTGLLYSKEDRGKIWTDFGANIRGDEGVRHVGVASLIGALEGFELSYNRLAEIIPAFIALCENDLKAKKASGQGSS